jgi:rhodanese-related sulfurtransferase
MYNAAEVQMSNPVDVFASTLDVRATVEAAATSGLKEALGKWVEAETRDQPHLVSAFATAFAKELGGPVVRAFLTVLLHRTDQAANTLDLLKNADFKAGIAVAQRELALVKGRRISSTSRTQLNAALTLLDRAYALAGDNRNGRQTYIRFVQAAIAKALGSADHAEAFLLDVRTPLEARVGELAPTIEREAKRVAGPANERGVSIDQYLATDHLGLVFCAHGWVFSDPREALLRTLVPVRPLSDALAMAGGLLPRPGGVDLTPSAFAWAALDRWSASGKAIFSPHRPAEKVRAALTQIGYTGPVTAVMDDGTALSLSFPELQNVEAGYRTGAKTEIPRAGTDQKYSYDRVVRLILPANPARPLEGEEIAKDRHAIDFDAIVQAALANLAARKTARSRTKKPAKGTESTPA